MDLNLFTGLAYALKLSQDGLTVNSIESLGSYTELADLPYQSAGLIQGQAGVELSYKLNKRPNSLLEH